MPFLLDDILRVGIKQGIETQVHGNFLAFGIVVFLSAATMALRQTSKMFPPKLRHVRSM